MAGDVKDQRVSNWKIVKGRQEVKTNVNWSLNKWYRIYHQTFTHSFLVLILSLFTLAEVSVFGTSVYHVLRFHFLHLKPINIGFTKLNIPGPKRRSRADLSSIGPSSKRTDCVIVSSIALMAAASDGFLSNCLGLCCLSNRLKEFYWQAPLPQAQHSRSCNRLDTHLDESRTPRPLQNR